MGHGQPKIPVLVIPAFGRNDEFALKIHPDKTRLIEFGRHAAARRSSRDLAKPETFDFLGFTHICGRSRKGKFLLKRIKPSARIGPAGICPGGAPKGASLPGRSQWHRG